MSPTLSEHQLCVAVRRPRALARLLKAEAKAPMPEDTPRSPIRPMLTAVLRGYFKAKRAPDKAREDYAKRVAAADRRQKLAVQFAKGEQVLEVFLMWDSSESPPTQARFSRSVAPVCGWQVRLGHDLIYERSDGVVLRQIVMDSGIRQSVDLRLFAVASLPALRGAESDDPTVDHRDLVGPHAEAVRLAAERPGPTSVGPLSAARRSLGRARQGRRLMILVARGSRAVLSLSGLVRVGSRGPRRSGPNSSSPGSNDRTHVL